MMATKNSENEASEALTVLNGVCISPLSETQSYSKNTEKTKQVEKMNGTTVKTKLYKRRWLQLVLFVAAAMVNLMQLVQYTIIGNIISRYYDVSLPTVNWTSLVFNFAYVALLYPSSCIVDRVGLRWTCIIGSVGTCIGSWIKVFSVSPYRYAVTFAGQILIGGCQVFAFLIPARLAATWFDVEHIAIATAIASLGPLLGIATFSLITPIVVKNHERIEDIGSDLSNFFWTVALISTVVTIVLFLCFQDQPRLPPSETRALQKSNHEAVNEGFYLPFKRLMANKNFFMLWNSYGIGTAVMSTSVVLMNPMVLAHYRNGEEDAGRLGLLLNVFGIVGAVACSMILDKTKKFKLVISFTYVFAFVGRTLFAVSLLLEIKWMVYVSGTIFGIFVVSYCILGFEVGAETTYPEAEYVSSGLLAMATQSYSILMLLAVCYVMQHCGDIAAHAALCLSLLLGIILTLCTKFELKREQTRKKILYDAIALEVTKSKEGDRP